MSEEMIGRLDDFEDEVARRIEIRGRVLAVVRLGDEVFAVDDTCSHAEASLSEGDVYGEEREIECPLHGSTFELVTGEPTCLPATVRVETYPTRVEDGDVWVAVP